MEKRKTLIINFLYFAIIIAIAYFVLEFAFTLLLPFVAALFIAYILRHPIRFLAAKTKLPKKLLKKRQKQKPKKLKKRVNNYGNEKKHRQRHLFKT